DQEELGKLFYMYSQRVNLGRIQSDVNALWSFAPHDVSIMNYWLGQEPLWVATRGFSYLNNGIEDVVFVTLEYPGGVGAHFHLGWLDPRKVRLMTLVGSKKMLVYDDVSLDAKIQIYDKGIVQLHDHLGTPESFAEFQLQLRVGDLVIPPTLQFSEPLQNECQHFIDCIRNGQRPLTDGLNGLRVVKVLEAAEQSLKQGGLPVGLREIAGVTNR
ncbi:MAG TPA: Gfo/Idh/MocA family oxidoreductase, partial [Nitrospiraceae bacterium]|nr:Gfo/Idh/MocA family oxidoreductase [Nitrospiraceae bacterium]